MTAKDLDSLRAAVSAALPDNTTRLIDPADVRQIGFIDSIDSLSDRVSITPQMFGAVGDSDKFGVGTNDSSEIQLAADFCRDLNATNIVKPTLLFPRTIGVGYKCNSTIFVEPDIHIHMDSPIVHTGDQTTKGLVVGKAGVGTGFLNLNLRLTRAEGDTTDWTDESSTGIQLINLNTCDVWVDLGQLDGGFTIGLECLGLGTGFSNNILRLGAMRNNKITVKLNNQQVSSVFGFCNENLFIGGRYAVSSGINIGKSRIGILVTASTDPPVDFSVNHNVFLKPNIELNGPSSLPEETIPILIEHGNQNEFLTCRNENNGPLFARILNSDVSPNRQNRIDRQFNEGIIDDQSKQASTRDTFARDLLSDGLQEIFDSNALHRLASFYNGSTTTHVPDCHFVSSANAVTLFASANVTWSVTEACTVDNANNEIDDVDHDRVNGDNVFFTGTLPAEIILDTKYFVVNSQVGTFQIALTLGGSPVAFASSGSGVSYHGRNRWVEIISSLSIGRLVDTTTAKQFMLSKDVDLSGNPGRTAIIAFDSDGVQLLNQDTFTVDAGTDEIIPDASVRPHSLVVGDPITFGTTGSLPGGLPLATVVFVSSTTATRFKYSLTLGGADEPISAVAGSGVQTYRLENHYVKGESLVWNNSRHNGCYIFGSDIDADSPFLCRDEVKQVNVMIAGGAGGSVLLRRFRIFSWARNKDVDTQVGYEQGGIGKNIAITFPTAGVYLGVGSQEWNHTPAAGGVMGWMLVTEGPNGGTWAAMPSLAP